VSGPLFLYVEETPNLNNYTFARVSFIAYKDLQRYTWGCLVSIPNSDYE